MDWLSKYHSVIVCDEKILRIPFGNEILIVRGMSSLFGIITTKKVEDKSGRSGLEDCTIVRDFLKLFLEDLGFYPDKWIFKIGLIPGAAL
ncbi:hypothetical protein Tco_0553859 [Tanacetum coccineum]